MGAGMLHAHLAIASQHVCLTQRKSLHGISRALICTTDSTVSQPPVTLLINVHCHQNLHSNLDMRHKVTLGVRTLFVNVAHFEWRHNYRHWPIKDHNFIRVTFEPVGLLAAAEGQHVGQEKEQANNSGIWIASGPRYWSDRRGYLKQPGWCVGEDCNCFEKESWHQ